MMRHRRGKKTIRALKREVQQRLLVRGLFLGMKTTAIAKQLKLTSQTVRDWSAKPDVQAALDAYTQEQFEALDRRFPYALKTTMELLIRRLKRGDWKATDAMLRDTWSAPRFICSPWG
jgi:transposase